MQQSGKQASRLFKLIVDSSLEIAQITGVLVVPVVTEFTYDAFSEKEQITKMHIRYGNPLSVTLEDDLNKKLLEYSEVISTIRWELI